jgi:hypothetical protein
MATEQYSDCGLYVDVNGSAELLELLRRRFGAPTRFTTFTLPGFQLDVVRHKERTEGPDEDFLSWRAIAEVYADGGTSDEDMVRFVTDLMGYLRSTGHRVVADCDFEDELPQDDLV